MTMEPATEAAPEQPRKSSGYRRLQTRHRALIGDHEALQRDYYALLDQQRELQADIDRLLEQHGRLVQTVKAPPQASNWYETANLTLAQLAVAPDPQAVRIFVSALVQLQSRISPIVARTPLA
jgi:uncharacterized protein (DUF3084 family)